MIGKNIAREKAVAIRVKLSKDDVDGLSSTIAANAYSFVKDNSFKNVAIYMGIKNEAKMEYIIKLDTDRNIYFYLPQYSKGKYICFNKFESIDTMKKDDYGILCPKDSHPIDIKAIEVFFVPGVAFDMLGNRVGYGKGCYDRALNQARNSLFVGVCYDFQLILNDSLEFNDDDVRMHYLLTENGFIKVNN